MSFWRRSGLAIAFFTVPVVAHGPAMGQAFGPFTWQFLPFCNVVTLTAVQQGGVFVLSGFDDGCGAAQRLAASGSAFFNPDGSIGMGLTIIAQNGVPVNEAVRLDPATLSGTWMDSAGQNGMFQANPALPAGGSPRPVPVLPTGPQGPAGATNVVVRTAESGFSTLDKSASVDCQGAERATGGGFFTHGFVDDVRSIFSNPRASGVRAQSGSVPNGWEARILNPSAVNNNLVVYVVCASP